MKFPKHEHRSHHDVFAGMLFYFVDSPHNSPPLFESVDDDEIDKTVPWLVLGKELIEKFSGSYWRFLLLGPGPDGLPRLTWYTGELPWIRRVADPVWEEREENGYWRPGVNILKGTDT